MKNKFYYGIEHEIPLINKKGNFLDYRNLNYETLDKIVKKFPLYPKDYPILRIGDLGIKVKRLYIEGYEIFDRKGYLIKSLPKGFELRTLFFDSIEELVNSFIKDFKILKNLLEDFNLQPTFISFNPYLTKPKIKILYHQFERKLRKEDPGRRTAIFTLLSYGPDINISYNKLSDEEIFDYIQKITFYTPFIIPFTFSSPFYKGKLYGGYSLRCYLRHQIRTVCQGFVDDENLIKEANKGGLWLLAKKRIEKEKGRIEFKAIDTIFDLDIYKGILVLLKGMILDKNLKERAKKIDFSLLKISTDYAFDDKIIFEGTEEVLRKVNEVLKNNKEQKYLEKLFYLHKRKLTPAKLIIEEYLKTKSINKTLLKFNDFRKI